MNLWHGIEGLSPHGQRVRVGSLVENWNPVIIPIFTKCIGNLIINFFSVTVTDYSYVNAQHQPM